ncbi:M23 family metallopeptidase [Phenylobacterium sp.]|uniref:M23 family metallopeptidase n=1 Tax=Phenylobacterium sp. TaxID=1871053 RepID=UPI0027379A57|nr:M23 family metallopeptidase [Phenylobacterium sp.]MDP3869578.1 M23 family metallopeptidase [Phenylobacterium sp.]
MLLKSLSTTDRVRHFGLEVAVAGVLALSVATVAYAARPNLLDKTDTKPPVAAPVEEVAPPPPPPAFECGNPVPGEKINSPFGLRRMPWEDRGRLHEGVDIAGPVGTRVVAVSDGIVIRAGESASYGRYVEVEHGVGLTSFYAHLGKIERGMKKGAYVEAGKTVGRMGSSGTSTGPHLHFEIRQDDKPLNPLVFLNREFATAEDLPIKLASYVSPRVRLATVSEIPESKKALMEAKGKKGKDGRVRQTLKFQG